MTAGLTRKRLRDDKSEDHASKRRVYVSARRQEERELHRASLQRLFSRVSSRFLKLPTETEVHDCYGKFYQATSNTALSSVVCGVCARLGLAAEDGMTELPVQPPPNRHRLKPSIFADEISHVLSGNVW